MDKRTQKKHANMHRHTDEVMHTHKETDAQACEKDQAHSQ